jgi:hypothetical protein
MESVLSAFILIFLLIFGVMTLSNSFIATQDTLRASWQEMESRISEQSRTNLVPLEARVLAGGSTLELTLRNAGAVKMADFERWDVIVQYQDAGNPSVQHIRRLAYNPSTPLSNEWGIEGLYLDASERLAESYERRVLNSSEELVTQIKLLPPVQPGTTVMAFLSTANGVGAQAFATRNAMPVNSVNFGLALPSRTSATISSAMLQSTDANHPATELTYSITALPAQGSLSRTSFTQADIDSGLLQYQHTGDGDDTFAFTVTDGEYVIGAYTFRVNATNAAPEVVNNNGLDLAGANSATITSAMLQFNDVDNTSDELVYNILAPGPTQGALSTSWSFTQADIDTGSVIYTKTVTAADSFQFTVSDGDATIGPFTFTITP